ncbi:type IV pilus assembly protein PilM [Neisseria weaveri]|uniref:type IV pilus assembly protein PilM n=1 Tax=Neisseria weaveri TaxID=28091 RepID=UPI000D30544B|nr:type IV pilus assembly protein PilM [Neisseria weaveri]
MQIITHAKNQKSIKNHYSIGVDINQHSIRIVQLSGSSLNQIQLEKYNITKLPANIVKGNKIQDYGQLVAYLQHAFSQSDIPKKNIVASLPQNTATIENLVYNNKETDLTIEEFVESEVSQISPLEEMNYDFQITGPSLAPPGQKVLLVISRKDEVDPRIELFENASLPLSALDIDIFAQSNAFNYWINNYATEFTNDKIAIFGIYATQMYALIIQNGQILYKQETPVSDEQLNQLIQRTYQVTEEKADNMMYTGNRPSDYQTLVADRFNAQVAQEIQRVLQFYYTTQPNDQYSSVKHIFLTGIASQQTGLAEAVFSQTNTATQCINPITYIKSGNQIELSKLQIDAPSLTIAFGLALRGL